MVGVTTLITQGVVEVELRLAGIIQRHRICQDRLHNHRFQCSETAKDSLA